MAKMDYSKIKKRNDRDFELDPRDKAIDAKRWVAEQRRQLKKHSKAYSEIQRAAQKRDGKKDFTYWPCKGKHYNQRMDSLPNSYLMWVMSNFDSLSVGYRFAVHELHKRGLIGDTP